MFKRISIPTVVVLLLMLMSPFVLAQEKAILVLDASGSMWGQIDGKAKITIARDVIAGVVKDWNQENHIGLITYGHRSKGDCKDIEQLIPVGKLDVDAFNKAVSAINPKGKTPLTEAVRIAAKELKYTEDKATVILVSDGKETCNADPCAVARELDKLGVDFTTHVIGFDVSDKESIGQLKCLAENTGGVFLTAKDAGGLKEALVTAVEKVAEPEPEPVITKVDPGAPVNIRVQAIAAEGGKPLDGTWFGVYRQEQDQTGKINRVKVTNSGYTAEAQFTVKPGEYIFYAEKGASKTEQLIKVEAGKGSSIVLIFNSGWLRSTAIAAAGGKPLGGTWFGVYKEETDETGRSKRVKHTNSGYTTEGDFFVPAGDYILYAERGASKTEISVTVEAGKGKDEQLVFNSGWLRSTALAASGGKPLGGTWFGVYKEETDETGRSKRVKHTNSGYTTEGDFFVPAGDYILYAERGASKTEMPVTVEAGKGKDERLVFNSGWLRSTAVAAAGGEPMDGVWFGVYKEVTDDTGKSKRVKHTNSGYTKEGDFFVPAGEYILYGEHGASKTEQPVVVEAGKGKDEQLVFNSGWVRLTGVGEEGGQPMDGTWFGAYKELVDDSGKTQRLKHTNSGYTKEASFFMPAGEYILYGENKGHKGEKKMVVEAGKSIAVQIVMDQPK